MNENYGLSAQKLIIGEISSLIIALRTNTKYTSPNRFVSNKFLKIKLNDISKNSEHPLLVSLKELKHQISSKNGFLSIEPLSILKPFFSVIRSEELTGPITGIALTSIEKFLRHPWINSSMDGAKAILNEIIEAIKQCQFELTVI